MFDLWVVSNALIKVALYLSGFLSAGGAIVLLLYRESLSRISDDIAKKTAGSLALALFAAGLSYLQRAAALTGDIQSAWDFEILGILWQTPVGTVLMLRVFGFCLLLISFLEFKLNRLVGLVGGIVLLASFTQIGHVYDLNSLVFQLLLLAHLVVVSFWIGILWPLQRLSSDVTLSEEATEVAHRFGKHASTLVPLLFIAGVLIGWNLLGGLSQLLSAPYGQTLMIKLGFFTILLGFAAANKLRFVPAMRRQEESAYDHLVQSIKIERALMFAILITTAWLTSALTLP